MAAVALVILLIVLVGGLIVLSSSIRIVQQFEHGIVFRFGQVQRGGQLRPGAVRGPGLTVILPIIERMQKVSQQTITMGVPGQDGITQDNVSVRVDAVVYFRVVDPVKAIVNVHNYGYAVSQVAQTSLRSVIGQADMQELLGEREKINMRLRAIIDEITEGPWGVLIERVEIKDVSLPEGMKRSMARQAEAERERRARIITADGEFQASSGSPPPRRSCRRTRRPSSCACCRRSWRCRPRRTARWSCRCRSRSCGSSTASPAVTARAASRGAGTASPASRSGSPRPRRNWRRRRNSRPR